LFKIDSEALTKLTLTQYPYTLSLWSSLRKFITLKSTIKHHILPKSALFVRVSEYDKLFANKKA
jgi:hypothetical protein